MIRTFKDKEAEKVFKGRFSKKLPQNIQQIAEQIDFTSSIGKFK